MLNTYVSFDFGASVNLPMRYPKSTYLTTRSAFIGQLVLQMRECDDERIF